MNRKPFVVRAYLRGDYRPFMDEVVYRAAGRPSDFAGYGGNERDHGWECGSEVEAYRLAKKVSGVGYICTVEPNRCSPSTATAKGG